MPKPVLSDSLFNADNVATAILSQANLQIASSDLGVADVTSIFTAGTDVTLYNMKAFTFNGFMFVQGRGEDSSPAHNSTVMTISDSNYRPYYQTIMPSVAYEGDTMAMLIFQTNGDVQTSYPVNVGTSTSLFFVFNGFYRFA